PMSPSLTLALLAFLLCYRQPRRPPMPQPFPYTTLFRSSVFHPAEYGVITDVYAWVAFLNVLYTFGMETAFFRFATKEGANPNTVDRKSTRLNSSHVKISYAVFCLKKK